MPRASDSMTAREKKIFLDKLSKLNIEKLGDIWKVNRSKKLSPKELEQFDLIRAAYKKLSGNELPKHSL